MLCDTKQRRNAPTGCTSVTPFDGSAPQLIGATYYSGLEHARSQAARAVSIRSEPLSRRDPTTALVRAEYSIQCERVGGIPDAAFLALLATAAILHWPGDRPARR